ncbi:uncharacterized protein LOC8284965 [Ricinus communis]|uniref:Micronuclear linker histone polyprotein, putative n=1 Tax=Ricinus communis TaxID=3988 RepID=B9RW62_RICCO|nr:uncharacterized protein LOC8284965 [Ricinus communis]EEF44499.1 micronuclear linker histone polyprotein, putative [Ricinus communis]|eukprot:XP_002517981.1 uncharacterized protein LOC8284965 [Ricinus communis]
MAMGASGSYKGSSRGKPYGVMLLLAFGAALLGVMVIHKLRERRIFNLLVKEKDSQLISLHLLLQKEKEYNKEMKRKTEEMKAKIYSLRNQKMETERRILELQSTIDSLKDEMKIVESALEEKQNEINIHTETSMYPEKETQMIALMESLKQREAEIEDLKSHLENPLKIPSVSTGDPSNTQLISNVTGNSADGDKTEDRQLHKSTNYSKYLNPTRGNESDNASTRVVKGDNTARVDEARSENKVGITDSLVVNKEGQLEMLENSLERLRNKGAPGKESSENGQGNKDEGSQASALGLGEENKFTNVTEGIVSTAEKVSQTGNADMKSVDGKGQKAARDGQLELKNSQQEKGRERTFKGAVKSEMIGNARSSNSRVREKHAKGKRWRILARNRTLENRNYESNEAGGIRKRKFSSNDRDGLRDREEATTSDKGKTGSERVTGADKLPETKAEGFSNAKIPESQNPEDTVDTRNKLAVNNTNHLEKDTNHLEKVDGMSNRLPMQESFDSSTNDSRSKAKKESLDGVKLYEDQGNSSNKEGRNTNMQNRTEQVNDSSKHEMPVEIEAVDADRDTDSAALDFYKESFYDSEEDKEENKEETKEPEF